MTYANITKKNINLPTFANITKKFLPNNKQKIIESINIKKPEIQKLKKRRKKKTKKQKQNNKKTRKKELQKTKQEYFKKYFKLDKDLKKKKNNIRIIFISGHGDIDILLDKPNKTELSSRIDMSDYQPGKENSKNNDFYLLKLSGIFDKVYNDALYNLFYFLGKKPLEPKIKEVKDENERKKHKYMKYIYDFQKKFYNFDKIYNEIDIINSFNILREKFIYTDEYVRMFNIRDEIKNLKYQLRFYPKYIEEFKLLREKFPSDDNIDFYPHNNLTIDNYNECMGIYDLNLNYKGDTNVKVLFDSIFKKIKKQNVKIKSYRNVEGDNLTSNQYKHQKNLYESLLLFDYNKKYEKLLKEKDIIDYKFYREYTKFNRKLIEKIENEIDTRKFNFNKNQINLNDYKDVNFKTSDIIELIYNTIIETEYNNNENAFHDDMKKNNKKILIIDGSCKSHSFLEKDNLSDDEIKKIKYFRRQSIDPTLKDKFDFTNTYYKDNKRYVNKEYIRYDLLDELAYEFENRFADNLLYEASDKYKENLDKCLDGVYKDIQKTSKPSRYFEK